MRSNTAAKHPESDAAPTGGPANRPFTPPPSKPTLANFDIEGSRFVVLSVPLEGQESLDGLTAAECEVALLAAAGLSNRAIACARRTSTRTTANQMASILAKLRLASRFELAGLAAARRRSPEPVSLDSALDATGPTPSALQNVALAAAEHPLRSDPQGNAAAPQFWHGLVEGHLRLLGSFESRSRRYFLASEAAHALPAPILDSRERRLAELIGSGQSEKAAAYELRVGPGTASVLLKTALTKLGLRSRVDLVALVRTTLGT